MKKTIGLLLLAFLFSSIDANSQTKRYFRQIAYNHVSPHVPIRGIHEVKEGQVGNDSHYIFSYDEKGNIVEIINNHYATERRHPLTTIGAYQTKITRSENKETWIYYDKRGNRISNDRRVFKEEFSVDKKGFRSELNFYDPEDKPMESMWAISRYSWKKKGAMVIEKRFNLSGEEVNVSPYFNFGTTGIEYNKQGYPKAHHNLDDQLKIANNSDGLASYKDEYDANGNHIKWSYFDQSGQMIKNQWGYAYGTKAYDSEGNFLGRKTYDEEDNLIQDRPMVTNVNVKMAEAPSREDSIQIKSVSKGYLEALQELDSVKMKRVMHTMLAKRTIGFDRASQKENIRVTTYDQMINFSKSWNKSGNRFPFNPSNEAIILDIYDRIATVKLVSDNWVEYLHLTKENGEWKITNMVWSYKNVDSYSHHSR